MAVRLSEALLTPKEQSPSLRSRDDIEHAVSPVAFPLLHHFEMKGRIGVGPRSSDVFLVANGNELRGLRGPGLFQKGPSKGNFNSICSLPFLGPFMWHTGMGFNFQETIHKGHPQYFLEFGALPPGPI